MSRKRRSRPKVSLADLPWDTGPAEQHRRSHRVEERGEVDPDTGKVKNPNDVRGIRYLTPIDEMHRRGLLTREHVGAAIQWAELCHRIFGSPTQRSCLNTDPIGYDLPEVPPAITRDYRELSARMGQFRRRLLDATCYRHEPCPERRIDMLVAGLDNVLDYYRPRTRRA